MSHVVLFVGGEPGETAALKRRLHRESRRIVEASSGRSAVEMCDAEPVDVIVADERTAGMPGLEVLAEIQAAHPETIRLLLVGPASAPAAVRAAKAGVIAGFLVKPCDPDYLLVVLRQSVSHRDVLAENQRLNHTVAEQALVLRVLEKRHPGITNVHRDDDDAVIIEPQDVQNVELDANAAAAPVKE